MRRELPALLLLASCVPAQLREPLHEHLAEVCHTDELQVVDVGFVRFEPSLSEGCVVDVGEALALDWSSFDAEPHEIRAEVDLDLAHAIVAAAVLMLAEDRPAGGLHADAPQVLRHAFEARFLDGRVAATDPIGRVWFDYLIANSEAVRGVPNGTFFRYQRTTDQILAYRDYEARWWEPARVADWAATLLHEATHGALERRGNHVICPSWYELDRPRGCDLGPNSAYGVSAYFLWSWAEQHCDDDRCWNDAAWYQGAHCWRILDDAPWAPCDELEHGSWPVD